MTTNHFNEMNSKPSKASTTEPIANLTVDPESVQATNLVNELRAAGVVLRVSGNKLTAQPWNVLTTEQQRAYRKHRAAIKSIVRAEEESTRDETANTEPATAPPQPDPPICPYCCRVCVGAEHPAFRILHANDPTEVGRRGREATAVMFKTVGYFSERR